MTATKQTTTKQSATNPVPTKKRGRGRPKKTEVEAKKVRNKVGRPVGDAGIMKEYKSRMLASPRSQKILDEIMNAALDDNHKHQSVAWKIWADRVIPVSMFDKDATGASQRPTVEIKISTVGSTTTDINSNYSADTYEADAIEGEVVQDEPN